MIVGLLFAILMVLIYKGRMRAICRGLQTVTLIALGVLICMSSCTKAQANETGVQVLCAQVGTIYRVSQDMHLANLPPQTAVDQIDKFNMLEHKTVVQIVNQVYFDPVFADVPSTVVDNGMRRDCLDRFHRTSYTPAR